MAQETEANSCDTDGVAHQHALVLRRVFDASPERIWKAWMTPELWPVWWAATLSSFSMTTRLLPGRSRRRLMAVARPTMPPPTTAKS